MNPKNTGKKTTQEERQLCEDLYFLYSGGETIASHKWNDKGANALYRMIMNVQNCSVGIAWLPKIPTSMPTTIGQAASYLFKYLYESVQKHKKLKGGKMVVEGCMQSHFVAHKSIINLAVAGI